jgi:hypothetical protein
LAVDTIPVRVSSISVRFAWYSFGSVRVDGVTYDHDLIIDRGRSAITFGDRFPAAETY